MNSEIKITRAALTDAKLLSELSIKTFYDTYAGMCPESDMYNFVNQYFNQGKIGLELQHEEDMYFIAFKNDIPVGYMRIKEDYHDLRSIKKYKALQIKRIYVVKEFHLQKVGASLMKFAIDLAIKKNYDVLWLGVWEENEKAISFYKKFGFKKSDEKAVFHIGNTAQTDHWMIKFINSMERTPNIFL